MNNPEAFLNRCPLCTHRPVAVTVRPRYRVDDDLTGSVEYRRGPREGGQRVSLAWSDLCHGCSRDLYDLSEKVELTLPESVYVSQEPYRVEIDWQAIVLGLRY